jgi:hypothetical protein
VNEPQLRDLLTKMPHKPGVNPEDWQRVESNLLTLAHFYLAYCTARKLPVLITSIIRPRIEGQSVSDTHAQGRAFDASVRGLSVDDLDDILIECNRLHAPRMGAFRLKDEPPIPRCLVYEYGQGMCLVPTKAAEYCKCNGAVPHLHFQVRP